jgi:hypothetical protein
MPEELLIFGNTISLSDICRRNVGRGSSFAQKYEKRAEIGP